MKKIFFLTFSFVIICAIGSTYASDLFFKSVPMTDLPSCYGPSAGDIDGDGDIDAYCTYHGVGYGSLLINNGDATFTTIRVGYMYKLNNRATQMVDMDNDGDLDILVEGQTNNLFLENLGGNTFLSHYFTTPHIGSLSWGAAIADFNQDGYPDIYMGGNNTINNRLVLSTHTGGNFGADYSFVQGFSYVNLPGDAMGFYPAAGDLNSDGKPDIYAVSIGGGAQNRLYINQGSGSFIQKNISGDVNIENYGNAIIADFNGDGTNDIYTTTTRGNATPVGATRLWLNDGFANFTEKVLSGANSGAGRYAIAVDIDNDGDLDVYNNIGLGNQLWLNDGFANFTLYTLPADYGAIYGSISADFDNNGLKDIWVPGNHLWMQYYPLNITITAPTKFTNTPITDTTITITGSAGVYATGVSIDTGSTASASNLNCTQTSSTQVDCTISIDTSGTLKIRVVDALGTVGTASEPNYIIDTIPPTVPNLAIDTQSPYSVHAPQVVFSTTDNIAVNYCRLQYIADDGLVGSVTGTITTINPAISPLVVNLDPDESLHTIKIRCYDTAGNYSDNIIKFPPIVTFTTPTQISNTNIEDAKVTITSPDDNNIDSIVISSTISPTPTLTNCLGDGGDTDGSDGYASPVVCEIHGITQSGTVQIEARDVVTNGVGQNSVSFILDTISPAITITSPTFVSNIGITTTTITVTDDVKIYATGVTIGSGTTALYSSFICTQTNATTVDCTIQIDDDGDIQIIATDKAGNTSNSNNTGYIIDTISPIINLIDDTNGSPNTGDILVVTVNDDIKLQTGTLLYGYSADALCDSGDIYSETYESATGFIISDETHNGEYICFQAKDWVNNISYIGTTHPLQIDITAPILNFVSGSVITHEVYTPWLDTGYTVVDNFRSGSDITVTVSGTVNTGVLGNNIVDYIVRDVLGNTASYTRTIQIVDTTAPIFSGIMNETIEINTIYSGYSGYSVSDNYYPITGITVTMSGLVNTGATGNYLIQYKATDSSNNSGTIQKIVTVVDTIPPVITITSPLNGTIIQNNTFTTYFTGADNSLGSVIFECKVGSGSWTICGMSGYVLSGLVYGNYLVSVRGIDPSGNISNPVSISVSYSQPSGGGGGGGSGPIKDNCPNGDYTASAYDGSCGTKPTMNTGVIEDPKKPVVFENIDIYNTSISNGYCYKRKSNASIIDSLSITTTQEFKKSLTFLYAYDMTMFRSIDEFDPYRRLTREEAAKIFSNFAMNVLCRRPDKNLKISYSDVADANPTLKNYITLAYQLGLMKGGRDGKFRPFDTITKAEFNAVLIRMILKSYLPENSTDKWYKEYNKVSIALGIINYGATEVPIIRHDATVMLFRAYKEQKFDLRMIDYETYVLDTRDEYLNIESISNVTNVIVDKLSSIITGTTVSSSGSVSTGALAIKVRPQRRI